MRRPGNAGAGDLPGRPRAVLSSEMSACSACAGDYEDPDRTAWPTEEKAETAEGKAASEFPDGDPDKKN
jgi:hypothetical protein